MGGYCLLIDITTVFIFHFHGGTIAAHATPKNGSYPQAQGNEQARHPLACNESTKADYLMRQRSGMLLIASRQCAASVPLDFAFRQFDSGHYLLKPCY